MHDALTQSLAPILRDIAASGIEAPRIDDKPWINDPEIASAMLWSPDGSGTGIQVIVTAPEVARVSGIADQVQEWVIEELWGSAPTNWPPCPVHPNSHPLKVLALDVAMWACPVDARPVVAVGSL